MIDIFFSKNKQPIGDGLIMSHFPSRIYPQDDTGGIGAGRMAIVVV